MGINRILAAICFTSPFFSLLIRYLTRCVSFSIAAAQARYFDNLIPEHMSIAYINVHGINNSI